jgi:hypothetical protein
MADDHDPAPDRTDDKAWGIALLRELRESTSKREPLLTKERILIEQLTGALKALGHSPVELLMRSVTAEEAVRTRLRIAPSDDGWPTTNQLTPLLSGARDCPWPACDYLCAPSVLNRLLFLRQQNAPSEMDGVTSRPSLRNAERALWEPKASDHLWNLRLMRGANRAMAESWAPRSELDDFAESLRFNGGRVGRRPTRVPDHFLEAKLYIANRAFFGIMRKAQRELPSRLRAEDAIAEELRKKDFPAFLVERLAQEISEHRQRRRSRLTLEDRAALMTVELEGKRGCFGLPESLTLDESMGDEDVRQPVIVATRKPAPGPLRTAAAVKSYEAALARAVAHAKARVRRLRGIWASGPSKRRN